MKIERASEWELLEECVPTDIFKAEVHAWAKRIGVEPREIHIRQMKRKWGSCSSSGRLTFNLELLSQPADIRRRVIIEELVHLKVPNHGTLFRALLSAYLDSEDIADVPALDKNEMMREDIRNSRFAALDPIPLLLLDTYDSSDGSSLSGEASNLREPDPSQMESGEGHESIGYHRLRMPCL